MQRSRRWAISDSSRRSRRPLHCSTSRHPTARSDFRRGRVLTLPIAGRSQKDQDTGLPTEKARNLPRAGLTRSGRPSNICEHLLTKRKQTLTTMRTAIAPTPVSDATRIRMSGVERRQHFIDAALRLFSSSGFRGTSTRKIAEAAGVSEALLFRHFPSKADLYAAILQQKARESGFARQFVTLRRLARRADDWALVQYLVRAILASYARDPDFERLMLYAALEGHELATTSRQLFGQPAFALLRDYVVQRQQAGVFRQGDPASLVFALVALPAYFSMAHRLLGMQLAPPSDRTGADLFTRTVLDGVRVHADDLRDRTPKRGRALVTARRGAFRNPLQRRKSQ